MPVSRRNRIIAIAACAVLGAAGLGAGSAYAASIAWHGGGSKAHANASPAVAAGSRPGPGHADQAAPGTPSGDPSASTAIPTPSPTPTPGKSPTTGVTTKAPTKKPSATATPTATAPAPPAQNPSSNQAAIQGVFTQLNQLRATNSLPAFVLSNGLLASTHAHNLLMVNGCGLSHLCPGEAALGARVTAQGVTWTSVGENIGDGGKIADNDAAITEAAEGQTTGMYNEVAPDDGHRQNILSPAYGHVGIDVVIDTNGIVWMTQDFTD